MKYQPYPEYKDSGIEWLDYLPIHWDKASLRWFCKIYAGGTPSKDRKEYWDKGTIPWLNSGAVNQPLIKKPSAYITEDAYRNSSAKWIPKGALVIALAGQGKTKGTVAQLDIDATCNQSMSAIVPFRKFYIRFLYWWLNSNYQNIRNLAGGDLRDGLNLELIGSIECPIPSIEEQVQIATFLDRETQKIDRLIEKQQQLIKLLQEKRQAVISHVVTKGLNPNVKMKDSGVEWLGKIPEHWEVRKIKYIVELILTGTTPTTSKEKYFGGEINWFTPGDLDNELLVNSTKTVTDEAIKDNVVHLFPKDSVLVVGIGATTGKTSYLTVESAFNQQITGFHSVAENNRFLFYLFKSLSVVFINVANYTTLPILNNEFFKNFVLVIPGKEEQEEIVEFLDRQVKQIDVLINKCNQAIELMKERRTALISAAVTGKIDVRNMAVDNTDVTNVQGAATA